MGKIMGGLAVSPEMEPFESGDAFFRVRGHVAPGFRSVAAKFADSFRAGREANAQCCVYLGGERVVDLWGTSAEARDQRYDGDSLQLVFSNTKTVTALVVASLVDRGLVSYDDKVTSVWPEFARREEEGGDAHFHRTRKSDLTLADVMRHEAGLANLEGVFESPRAMWTDNVKRNKVGEVVENERCRCKEIKTVWLAIFAN